MEIRNSDARIVAIPTANDFGTGQGIDAAEAGTMPQVAIDPAGLQLGVIRGVEVRAEVRSPPAGAIQAWFCPNKLVGIEVIFVFCLRGLRVYTSIVRIQGQPLGVHGSR
jgi:hypothetical protein